MSRLITKNGVLHRQLGGVQSVPRVMRGVPVNASMSYDVPLNRRDLSGLHAQGIARTLSGFDMTSGKALAVTAVAVVAYLMLRKRKR
jgi:hypothetical protein